MPFLSPNQKCWSIATVVTVYFSFFFDSWTYLKDFQSTAFKSAVLIDLLRTLTYFCHSCMLSFCWSVGQVTFEAVLYSILSCPGISRQNFHNLYAEWLQRRMISISFENVGTVQILGYLKGSCESQSHCLAPCSFTVRAVKLIWVYCRR